MKGGIVMIAMIMRVCWSFHNYDWMNIEGVGEVLFGDSFGEFEEVGSWI